MQHCNSEDEEFSDLTVEWFLRSLGKSSYDERVDGNGQYTPFYFKDRATQFIEIYRGKQRRGMALMFAGKNEKNESTLLVNSIELSDALRTDHNRDTVIKETLGFIKDYGKRSGFKHILMSDHSYNPASHYGDEEPDFKDITKIHPWKEEFYSDALSEKGKGDTDGWKRV